MISRIILGDQKFINVEVHRWVERNL